MNLKTFRAASMAEALGVVKRELGPEAVILHTRTLREGGVLGVGSRTVVEVTAADQAEAGTLPGRRRVAREAMAQRNASGGVRENAGGGGVATLERPARAEPNAGFQPATFARLGEERAAEVKPSAVAPAAGAERASPPRGDATVSRKIPGVSGPVASAVKRSVPASSVEPKPAAASLPRGMDRDGDPLAMARSMAVRVRPAPVDPVAQETLEDEIRAIKRMVTQVLRHARRTPGSGTAWSAGDGASDAIASLDARLGAQDVAPELIERILGAVRDELSPEELADAEVVRSAALQRIAGMFHIAPEPPAPARAADGRPTTIALLGPTGVGKTTTLAKLAALHKLRHGKRVGLITSDTYRIAAVEQLRTYANIIGLPLRVALTPEDMAEACAAFESCDVVLIDTAGRSQHDTTRLDELRAFVDAARPHRRHLVLSAAAQEAVMHAAAERFGALAPDRLILTKLDESVRFGPLLSVATRCGLGLSYVTSGQEVPDDLETANAQRLARLVLDGRAVS